MGVLTTNLLDRRTPNYDGLASAVVSLPPLASAGLTEAAARGASLAFRTSQQDTSGWFNTRRVGETTAGSKVLIEEGTDRIIGAHLLGASRRRGDQPLRDGHSPAHSGGGAEAGGLRLPDVRLGHPVHGVSLASAAPVLAVAVGR